MPVSCMCVQLICMPLTYIIYYASYGFRLTNQRIHYIGARLHESREVGEARHDFSSQKSRCSSCSFTRQDRKSHSEAVTTHIARH